MSGLAIFSNSLRFLCSSVLQRLGSSITRSRAITRFSARVYQWYDSVFSRLLRLSLAMSDNSVRCCKQTTYISIRVSKKQALFSPDGRKISSTLATGPKFNACYAPAPESANQPMPAAEALGISLTPAHAASRRSHCELTINCGPQAPRLRTEHCAGATPTHFSPRAIKNPGPQEKFVPIDMPSRAAAI
jgi:hypothetical protein